MREVPFVRKADDLALATSHLAQSSSASRFTARRTGHPDPMIREKSQFRAQHDSLSLSRARDGTSLCLNFRALAALFTWAAYFFAPAFHAGGEMSAGHLPQG
jgi:hypothetical protein